MTKIKILGRIGLTLALGWAGTAGAAAVEQSIHVFTPVDGTSPESALLPDGHGGFYGTTFGGGSARPRGFGYGTIYHLIPPASGQGTWAVTVLYNFTKTGGWDSGDLVFGKDGALYGVVFSGASKGCLGGCGGVYRLAPAGSPGGAWSFSIIYGFKAAGTGGAFPVGGLVAGSDGSLYGVTEGGGTHGYGTIFELSPPAVVGGEWTPTSLHSFTKSDGQNPFNSMSGDPAKALYGTVDYGGVGCAQSPGCGTVYKLTPPASAGAPWRFDLLYRFANPADGQQPNAPVVLGADGALYGVTGQGGPTNYGEVFRLTPPATAGSVWTKTAIHGFTRFSDGLSPLSRLLVGPGGALYGNTYSGGVTNSGQCATYGCGTIFRMRPPAAGQSQWQFTVLHALGDIPDGSQPYYNPLTLVGDTLYEATYRGGAPCAQGEPFRCGGAAISVHR